VHVDHGQWNKKLLLVAVDTFSKWPEVFAVSSTSAAQTAEKLKSNVCHTWSANNFGI